MKDTPERDLALADELGRMADDRIRELTTERDRLRDALRPFVEKSPDLTGVSGSDVITLYVLAREIKAARAALKEHQ